MPERKIEYEVLNQKTDTGFKVRAPSVARLYVDAGLAVTDQIAKIERIEPAEKRTLSASGSTREKLMENWLTGVLSLFKDEKFVSRRIVFDAFDGKSIKATLTGEIYSPARHGGSTELKKVLGERLEMGDSETPEPHFFAKIFLGTL